MTIMASGSIAEIGERQIRGMFYERLELTKKLAWIEKVANMFTSDQESETYKWLTQSPVMREWVSGRQAKGFTTNGITIENLEFEATIGIKDKDLRRAKSDQIRMRIGELPKRSTTHWASLLTTLIMNGTSLLSYDGVAYFAANHVEGNSGTFSNLLTVSDYAELGAVAVATNPTANEAADCLMKVVQHFYSYKDDQGEPRNEDALEFICMVPVNLFGAFSTAVKSKMLTGASGSRDNPLMDQEFKISVVPNARLTWTTDFVVFRADAEAKPLIRQSEYDVQPAILGPGSDHFFHNKEWLISIEASRNVALGMHWQAIKATMS